MSNLSELLPAGGAAKEFEVVASGTLPNGKPVVMKSDGKVEVVVETTTNYTESIPAGSSTTFNSGSTSELSSAFDPNNTGKFVIAYKDDGASQNGAGKAIVGTVSGTSITFGTEVTFNTGSSRAISLSFDPNTDSKFVISYQDTGASSYGRMVVGTVSGTAVSFGSEYVFNSGSTDFTSVSFDPNVAGKLVVSYQDVATSSYGKATVGTVSGTTISFGSEYTFNPAYTQYISMSFDPNTANKFVVAYQDYGNSGRGKVVVGDISGTVITFGAEYTFLSNTTEYLSVAYDVSTANRFVVAYRNSNASSRGDVVVGTVSGTAITYGSVYTFNSGSTIYPSVVSQPDVAGKFVIAYRDDGNSNYGTVRVATVSGTAISFGSEFVLKSVNASYESAAFDPNTAGLFVVAYQDASISYSGAAILGQVATTVVSTNLTATNFAGTSTAAFTNGQTATIVPQGGVSTNQTSLTIGSTYYVQPAGTLATSAGTPSVVAGKAISATSLILKGNS